MRAGYEDLDQLVALHDAERAAEADPLSFVTAMSAFDQAVTELSGNRTLAVIAGVFRDIYAGQVYSAIGSDDAVSAERIARRVVVSHSAFLDAARRRDASLAQRTWTDYLFTTSRLLVSRNVSRQPIDMAPLWRAQAGQAGAEPTPRRAMVVATEIRSRIAEGSLGEGDRLPPLAELADEFGISRPTLREALRILEMEFLLDLRTGDRGGATIRTPSSRVAAQLAGIVLEARRTTLADFYRAVRLDRTPHHGSGRLAHRSQTAPSAQTMDRELADSIEDTARFVMTWSGRRADRVLGGQEPGPDCYRRDLALGPGRGRAGSDRRREERCRASARATAIPGAVLAVRRGRRRSRLRARHQAWAEGSGPTRHGWRSPGLAVD